MIDICTLGTGGALPMPERGLASLYVRTNGLGFLIDCGENTQTAIRKIGWGFKGINGILLTHYHADHCGGIPGLLLSIAKAGRTEPFHIFGCQGLERIINGLRVICSALPYEVILHDFGMPKTVQFEFNGYSITAFAVNHSIPCYGYRIEMKRGGKFLPQKAEQLGIPKSYWGILQRGESITAEGEAFTPEQIVGPERRGIIFLYATDTRPTDSIIEQGYDSDLMILQGMYGNDEKIAQAKKNHHMLYRQAAMLAKKAETKQLLLTHFSNCIDDPLIYLPQASKIFPAANVARDLLTIRLDWNNN